MKKSKNNLWRTKTYLVGHMQYKSGRDWRGYVTEELSPLGVTVSIHTTNHLLKM